MKIFPKSFLLPVFLTIIFWIECKLWGKEVGVVILNYSLLSFYRRVRLFSLILGPTRLQGDRQFEFWCQLSLVSDDPGVFLTTIRECLTASDSWVAPVVDLGKTRSPLYSCWKRQELPLRSYFLTSIIIAFNLNFIRFMDRGSRDLSPKWSRFTQLISERGETWPRSAWLHSQYSFLTSILLLWRSRKCVPISNVLKTTVHETFPVAPGCR